MEMAGSVVGGKAKGAPLYRSESCFSKGFFWGQRELCAASGRSLLFAGSACAPAPLGA